MHGDGVDDRFIRRIDDVEGTFLKPWWLEQSDAGGSNRRHRRGCDQHGLDGLGGWNHFIALSWPIATPFRSTWFKTKFQTDYIKEVITLKQTSFCNSKGFPYLKFINGAGEFHVTDWPINCLLSYVYIWRKFCHNEMMLKPFVQTKTMELFSDQIVAQQWPLKQAVGEINYSHR